LPTCERSDRFVELLDGDEIRDTCRRARLRRPNRDENIRRIGWVARCWPAQRRDRGDRGILAVSTGARRSARR
jgi:adenylylsulfate kinase-like enzyme